jgi:hypothetical protein
VKALGRAWRWKQLLEAGEHSSIGELATADNINHAYVRKLLRLTLLSPAITEMILNGRAPSSLQLEDLLGSAAADWKVQSELMK